MNSTESLRKREIQNLKEIFLFNYYLKHYQSGYFPSFQPEDINLFTIDNDILNDYLESFKCFKSDALFQNKFRIGDYDKWRKGVVESLPDKMFAQNGYVRSIIDTELLNQKEIQVQKHCEYCGVSIEAININLDKIKTKRILTRGRSLEVDKKEPNGHYIAENIALACYWCNNAKSDEYSVKEFEVIAKGIRKVWKERGIFVDISKTIYYKSRIVDIVFFVDVARLRDAINSGISEDINTQYESFINSYNDLWLHYNYQRALNYKFKTHVEYVMKYYNQKNYPYMLYNLNDILFNDIYEVLG